MNPVAHNPKDFWAGLLYIIIGLSALLLARDYDLGTAVRMGPGYFPSILSSILIIIGLISVTRSFLKPGAPIGQIAFKGAFLVILATLLFGFLIRTAGMVVAIPLLICVSAYASTRFNWRYTLALAVGMTGFSVLIFQMALGVPMPILGSWFTG